MSEYILVKPSVKSLNFDLDPYDKIKTAKNIILAINQAKTDGFSINATSWKSVWDNNENKWKFSESHNWCGIVASVLMYSETSYHEDKIKVVSNILNVEKEWLMGFHSTLNGMYESTVESVCKRKSKKGQHCRDGREFGNLFRLAYLSEGILDWYFPTTTKKLYDTHDWKNLDDDKILISLGMNHDNKIKKCENCSMYGGWKTNRYYNTTTYHINNVWDTFIYKYKDVNDLSCNEVIIKNIIC